MLKYVGDFEKLRGHGFIYRDNPNSTGWYNKYYHKELDESEIIITLQTEFKGEMEICLYDTSDLSEVIETVYDLIKNGLVIKEDN